MPVSEAGELVARDWGAEDTGSSTITSMSLLLSSGAMDPGCSSLLKEICTDKAIQSHWWSSTVGAAPDCYLREIVNGDREVSATGITRFLLAF